MLERLAGQIVGWQAQKGYLPDSEKEVYQYGYELLLNQLLNILIAVLIAVYMQDFMTVVLFLVCYIPLRSYCGGYHAKTHLRCSAVSALLLFMACLLMRMSLGGFDTLLILAAFILSGVLTFLYAPVESENKPLDETERHRYRKNGRRMWLIEAGICALLWIWNGQAVKTAALSHLTFAVLLYVQVLKNKIAMKRR